MKDKENLFELAIKKVDEDSDFMAFILKKYCETENISKKEVLSQLNCSLDDYYKLALCKVPSTNSKDFIERLNKMGQYTHISAIELNKIIKRVDTIQKFADSTNNTLLMAARDKKNDRKES